jgi:predicted nucleic acid-binding protein
MAIILDANLIIRGEKGSFDLSAWLATQANEEFEIAAITVAELWHGVERATGERRRQREQYLETVLAPLPIVPYTEEIAREHARVWAELEAAGKMSGYYDVIVAATARHRGSQLATFNRKHFENVQGLTLVEMAGN